MQSVEELRSFLRSRKATAESAFQTFKIQELVKDLPMVELTHNSLPNIPAVIKPRIR